MLWYKLNHFNRKVAVLNVQVQPFNELVNVVDDWRGLYEGVHACDVNSFLIADWRG